MSATLYRNGQTSAYAVAGTAALDSSYPLAEQMRRPSVVQQPQRRQQQQQTQRRVRPAVRRARLRLLRQAMIVTACLLLAGLSAALLNQKATVSANQKRIVQMRRQIEEAKNLNQRLEYELSTMIDGEQIRNYAVNTLGMVRLTDEQTRVLQMPATRPVTAAVTPINAPEEQGFFAVLGNLLRKIRI